MDSGPSSNTQRYPALVGIIKLQGGQVLLGDKIIKQDLWFDSGLKGTKENKPDEGILFRPHINNNSNISSQNPNPNNLYENSPLPANSAQIISAQERFWDAARSKDYSAHMIFDISHLLAVPGYIDIQTNGAFGLDYTTPPVYDENSNIATTALFLQSPPAKALSGTNIDIDDQLKLPAASFPTKACELKPKPNVEKVMLNLENPSSLVPSETDSWQITSTKPLHVSTPQMTRSSSNHHGRSSNKSFYEAGDDLSYASGGNNSAFNSPQNSIAASVASIPVTISSEWASNLDELIMDNLGIISPTSSVITDQNVNCASTVKVQQQHLHPNKARAFIDAYADHVKFNKEHIVKQSRLGNIKEDVQITNNENDNNNKNINNNDEEEEENNNNNNNDQNNNNSINYTFKPRNLTSTLLSETPPSLDTLRHILYHRDRDMLYVNERIPKYGVTSMCPTIISSDENTFGSAGSRIIEYMIAVELARKQGLLVRQCNLIGLHLEGPFISVPGAHNKDVLGPPKSFEHTSKIYNGDMLFPFTSIVTLAPEMEGALEVTSQLTKLGVVVAMGHSMSTIEQAKNGVKSGAGLITHMFNAMRGFHHRDPGLMGLLGANNPFDIHFSLIADGYHAHPYSVNIAHAASPEKLILVTDSMAAMGLPDGQYKLGTQDVTLDNRKAVLTDSPGSLAGAVVSLDQCVRNFVRFTHCTTEQAILAATRAPAELLGIYPRKGSLLPGADADIVLLEPDTLEVVATIVNGQLVYVRDDTFPFSSLCNDLGSKQKKNDRGVVFSEVDDVVELNVL